MGFTHFANQLCLHFPRENSGEKLATYKEKNCVVCRLLAHTFKVYQANICSEKWLDSVYDKLSSSVDKGVKLSTEQLYKKPKLICRKVISKTFLLLLSAQFAL